MLKPATQQKKIKKASQMSVFLTSRKPHSEQGFCCVFLAAVTAKLLDGGSAVFI